MTSAMPAFEFLDRGFEDTIVLIPGWASDRHIFSSLELDYNYITAFNFDPFNFEDMLLDFLQKKSIDRISLLGLSLGGFAAAEFSSKNSGLVNKLILIGIRRKYEHAALKEVGAQLEKNKEAFLYKFYQECFSDNDKEGFAWFKENLLGQYVRGIELSVLMEGLDYLAGVSIDPRNLTAVKKIMIIHGEQDRIAPIREAAEISAELPQAQFLRIAGSGHIPFLSRNFSSKL
ncbi:MAG: alpha/beta fold hydrolase [Deltaproteobacteria bacterium]